MKTFGKSDGGGRRTVPRDAGPLVGVFTTVTRSHVAIVVDLSQTGARLGGEDLPPEGEGIVLSVDAVQAFGTIVWSHDGECGVAFDSPLPVADVERLRQRVGSGAGLTLEMKAALDDWNGGFAR